MRRLRVGLLAVVCFAVGTFFGPEAVEAAAARFQEVLIRNTDAEPVPVRTIGTPSVNVANTPSVKLAGIPFAFNFEFRFEAGQISAVSNSFFVPDGKRLRIDYVSFHEGHATPVVEGLLLQVPQAGSPGGYITHYIATTPQGGTGGVASQPITAYADHSGGVFMSVQLDQPVHNDPGEIDFMHGSLTGVLLDA